MTRTVPSASANLTVTTTVARWEREIDDEVLSGRSEGFPAPATPDPPAPPPAG
jgi:hypothetical protein